MKHLSLRRLALVLASTIALTVVAASGAKGTISAQAYRASEGALLFATSGCPQCHGPEGLGTAKAPSLRDVRKRKTVDEVRMQIRDGGKSMPPFGEALSNEQIVNLVLFLRSKQAWTGTLIPSKSGLTK
jgi:mono/diheme cytochrome c family protein